MFRFALQPLLDRRKFAYEAARLQFAAAEQSAMQAERAREALEYRLREAGKDGEPQAVAVLLDRHESAVAAAGARFDSARRELAVASSSLCILESLRDRALDAYRQAQRRREEAEIDESNALCRSATRFGN